MNEQLLPPQATRTQGPNVLIHEPLVIELPSHFTQLESQTCYRIGLKNPSLLGACLRFSSDLAVFPFFEVGKRPILKEEFPKDVAPEDESQLDIIDVELKIFAGDEEIIICDDSKKCVKWREKTTKPVLVLTPRGTRTIQFDQDKEPFLLLIFRCCPRFHRGQEFEMQLKLTSRRRQYTTVIDLKRKKNQAQKKREQEALKEKTETGGREGAPIQSMEHTGVVLEKMSPTSGPATGGIPMRLEGQNLTQFTHATVNGKRIPTYLREGEEKEMVCFVPPGIPNTTAEICLVDDANKPTSPLIFRYTEPTRTAPSKKLELLQSRVKEMELRMRTLISHVSLGTPTPVSMLEDLKKEHQEVVALQEQISMGVEGHNFFDMLPNRLTLLILSFVSPKQSSNLRLVCKLWNRLLKPVEKKCRCALCCHLVPSITLVNWPNLIESCLWLMSFYRKSQFFKVEEIVAFIDQHWMQLWNPSIDSLETHKTKDWQKVVHAVLSVRQDLFEQGKDSNWALNSTAPMSNMGVALFELVNSKRKADNIGDTEITQRNPKKHKSHLVELSALALASLEELTRRDSDESSPDNTPPLKSAMETQEIMAMPRKDESNIIQDAWTVRPQFTSNPDLQNGEPVEVRSGRFVGVTLKDIASDKKRLFISWTTGNNGLPQVCRLLIPSVGNNFSLSFKTKGRGWVELTCKKAIDPFFEVDFEMRIDPVFEGDSSHRKGDATTIQFVLIDKNGSNLKRLGEAYLDVIVRSTKNQNKALTGRFFYTNTQDKPVPSKTTYRQEEIGTEASSGAIDLVPYFSRPMHLDPMQMQAEAPMIQSLATQTLRMPLPNMQSNFTLPRPVFSQQFNQPLPPFAAAPLADDSRHFYERNILPNNVSIESLMNHDPNFRDSRTQIRNLLL
jgi:hypothetical protein